ncbi:MAG: VWA domain-containing protein [Azospirillaceae bacterium]|nr:VWA domain-containing protein [Azospirillaceae bacterium]
MADDTPSPGTDRNDGRLAVNLAHFARALRAAGLPVGPGHILRAIEAAEAVGLDHRRDFYWALHAVFVNRRDQELLFDQVFHLFWRNPDLLKRMMALLLPELRTALKTPPPELARRVAEAMTPAASPNAAASAPEPPPDLEIDATLTWSDQERLQRMDFDKMSTAEAAAAKAAMARLTLPLRQVMTRRFRPDAGGPRIDLRATLRRSLRQGGNLIDLARKRRRQQPPPLVILCDISGSMGRYSRMLLHFMHAITNDRQRVQTFLFGTRLTNITRHLRHRDVDLALAQVTAQVPDWSGGTRIGACLHDFNRLWARRVLGQGALLLLITDGLDREGGESLSVEMRRLHRSCRQLIWLNPLLRFDGFEPKSSGIKAILPHVDAFLPVHNLESLAALAQALNRPKRRRDDTMARWLAALPTPTTGGKAR